MVEESAFRGVINILAKIGVYDIVLPFLLVFTIIFAILEKTKVLGLEKGAGGEGTKKNLNSMVAFVIAFLVIASTKLVSIINEVLANVVLLLILAVCFLMLVGVFFGDKEFTLKDFPTWSKRGRSSLKRNGKDQGPVEFRWHSKRILRSRTNGSKADSFYQSRGSHRQFQSHSQKDDASGQAPLSPHAKNSL